MNRLMKPFILVLASIYFLLDAVFIAVAKPVARWLANWRVFEGWKAWIVSLSPYPTCALFAVPLFVFEPAKPVAAYLAATGHVALGLVVFVVAEICKLVLVERLFAVSRDKLMSIPAFAWTYRQYRLIRERLEATAVWQAIRRLSKIAQYAVRSYLLELSQRSARIAFQQR